jgi:hypothetical protein
MPNWCYQEVSIYGHHDEINRFWNKIQGDDRQHIRLVNLMPMPSILEGTTSPTPADQQGKEAFKATGYDNWYDWANAVWGTKWGDCDTQLEDPVKINAEFSRIEGRFETAWSPFYTSFWETVTAEYNIAVIISMTEEADFYAGVQAFFDGGTIYENVDDIDYPKEITDLCNADNDDAMDRYWEAKSEYQSEYIDNQRDEAIEALRNATEGDATWSSWNSHSLVAHPSRGLPTL